MSLFAARKSSIPAFALAAFLLGAQVLQAAIPQKMVGVRRGESENGDPYTIYLLSCSDGEQYPMTSWTETGEWCIGEESREMCEKSSKKAAREACKIK